MFTPITLLGRVTKDLELQTSKNGTPYVQFSLAVTKGYGEQQHANFYQCVLYDKPAERIVKAGVKKGSLITFIGNLDCETYKKKDGTPGLNPKVTVYDWDYVPGYKKNDESAPAEASDSAAEESDDGFMDTEDCGENGLPFN